MTKGLRWGLMVVAAGALLAAGPVSAATGPSLTVKAPSSINKTKRFDVKASGRGNHRQNYLAVFFASARCKGTYAKEVAAAGSPKAATFVGKTFKNVTLLHNVFGGNAGTGFLCTYLYPKSSGSAWASKPPEAKNTHKITFTG